MASNEQPTASQTPANRRSGRTVGALAVFALLAILATSGCSTQTLDTWKRGGMPSPASDRAKDILGLWQGAWIAALIVGVIVWGLIIWAVIRYRKRDDKAPIQTRYHMPIETLFTVVPFIVVAALFFFTVRDQNAVLKTDPKVPPQQVVNVVGQQWSWTFNYLGPNPKDTSDDVYETGSPSQYPTLYLPVGQKVGFRLTSPDVIHSFWVPAFLFKMDVFPGKTNYFELTPTREGTYAGKCAELCGAYHSKMLFTVHVVSQQKFEAHLAQLRAKGQTGTATGGKETVTQEGLEKTGTETAR